MKSFPSDSDVTAIKTSVRLADANAADLWLRYEGVRLNDMVKNTLLEDAITRCRTLERSLKEHEQDLQNIQALKKQARQHEANFTYLQKILNRDPFILVLVDGDDILFGKHWLRDGIDGGKQMATVLHDAVAEWAVNNVVECPAEFKIVVRVYANIKGLAHNCVLAGLLDNPNSVGAFARGFTRGRTLFDFIDIGEESARSKIIENFQLYIRDYHCRQILLGCLYKSDYAHLLQGHSSDGEVLSRVTLLEGPSHSEDLAALPHRKLKLPTIFHNHGASSSIRTVGPQAECGETTILRATSNSFTPRNGFGPLTGAPAVQSIRGSMAQLYSSALSRRSAVRSDSVASSQHSLDSVNKPKTWATLVSSKKDLPQTNGAALPSPKSPTTAIRRNKKGQRIDDVLQYNREDVLQLKRLKLCNQYFLGPNGCCHTADKCAHRHDYKPSNADLRNLRTVARETPCKRGTACDDACCIYGHRCPFPLATEGTMRGVACLVGDSCRFPREMHAMDTKAVDMIRVTGTI